LPPYPLIKKPLLPSCFIFDAGLYFLRKDDMTQKRTAAQKSGKKTWAIPVSKVLLLSKSNGEKYCGPGMCQLLEAILETGTVRDACAQMNMSYSKGWKLLQKLEAWLGTKAAVRQQGGRGGGEALLTPAGFDFLKKYTAFEAECQRAVDAVFKKYDLNGA
jgi:molybdate transport system regulatory protein